MSFILVLACLAVVFGNMGILQYLIPAAAAYFGSKNQSDAAESAADAQNAATAYQQQLEAGKQKRLDELSTLAKTFLYGGSTGMQGRATGVESSPGGVAVGPTGMPSTSISGAIPTFQDWQSKLTKWLETAPDLTYNAQRGALERGAASARDVASRMAARRGLTGSGLSVGNVAGIDTGIAQGRANLIGEREQRRGQNLQTGYQISLDDLTRALNLMQGATGQAVGLQSQVPGMLQNTAAFNYGAATQPAAGVDLLAQAVQNAMTRTPIPTTVPAQSSSVPSTLGGVIGGVTNFPSTVQGYAKKLLGGWN